MNKNELFISKALKVHGDKYDYSKAQYINSKTKVCIICPEHGEFWQTPDKHVNAIQGCYFCGVIKMRQDKVIKASLKRNWDFEQPEDYKLIPLTQGKFAMVDNEDFDRVKDINWCLNSHGYAENSNISLMHSMILNSRMEIDHINHDKLDNRKSNLRVSTHQQNMCNSRPIKGSSVYKGVSIDKERNKWLAQIVYNKKWIFIGRYDTEYEASIARDLKALELQGDFAYLNHPEKKEEYLKQITQWQQKKQKH